MEASSKPQLPLDDLAEGVVRALDDRLVIERLTVADERAALVVRTRAETGQRPAQTVAKAIEIGARVLDSEETAANVDYVRAEFERHAGALRERLMKQLETGDEALSERIASAFDGSRDGSVQKEIESLLEASLENQREAILRLLRVEDEANPLFDYKQTMVEVFKGLRETQQREAAENRKVIADLRLELVELKERTVAQERVAEAEAAGTRKGLGFEDRVHRAIERIAAARGDSAHHTGGEASEGGGRKGDTVVEVGAAEGPCIARIVFEAKDKRGLSKQEAWRQLIGALEERSADFAVLAVAGGEQVPSGREPLHEYEGNKLIIALDRDEPDGLALETAYRLAVARVAMARDRSLTVDAAAVKDEAEAAATALKEAQKVRRGLTGANTSIANARAGLDAMVAAVLAHLERIDSLIAEADEAG
jgi:flagellar biosynthesis chaperone FliJ